MLVECDPSIKAIILKIDSERHDFIVEDLDDQTLVIKESMLSRLKARLEEVCVCAFLIFFLIWWRGGGGLVWLFCPLEGDFLDVVIHDCEKSVLR